MLKLIKIIHTIIWLIMVSAIFYIIYAGWNKIYDWRWWWASGLIVLEIGVLMINKFTCPLTQWARKYGVAIDDNFDIYLPN